MIVGRVGVGGHAPKAVEPMERMEPMEVGKVIERVPLEQGALTTITLDRLPSK